MNVVPDPSERWTTMISSAGRLTPGFSGADPPSFQRVIRPRKMSARSSPSKSSAVLPMRGQVVGHTHRAEHGGHVHDVALYGGDLLVGHRPVGGAEVHRALGKLTDAAAGPDRLVVDLHAGLLGVRIEPLGVERCGEGGPGSGQRRPPAPGRGRTIGIRPWPAGLPASPARAASGRRRDIGLFWHGSSRARVANAHVQGAVRFAWCANGRHRRVPAV